MRGKSDCGRAIDIFIGWISFRVTSGTALVLAVLGYWWLQWQSAPEAIAGPVSTGSAKYPAHDNDD